MRIRDLIEKVAVQWPPYRQKGRVDSSDPVYELVTAQFPEALQSHVAAFKSILVEGSTGAGNITAAPWIGLFDRRLTTSATAEYYVVYLFSTDLSTVTLALAFGTTQFEKQFGGPAGAFPRMRLAAIRLQEMFNHRIPANLARGPIGLAARPRQKLHFAYEQSTILSYAPYSVTALPDESQLVSHLQQLVSLYTEIVSDPLEPTVDRLVEAVVDAAPALQEIEVRDFELRPPRANREPDNRNGSRRRYSPESRKVGDGGERVVLTYERDRLTKLGRPDLADRIRWHAQELEFVGWDITSFESDATEIFIEVKSCVGKTITSVNLTVNEWQAACDPVRRGRYYIYLGTSALSSRPVIERLCNPAAYVEGGQVMCTPTVYALELWHN